MSCILLVALLAGCSAPEKLAGYRDPSAPIGVTSRFDADRMSGDWHVRGHLPADAGVREVNFITLDALPTMVTTHKKGTTEVTTVWRGTTRQAGRYGFTTDAGVTRDLVVIWIDEGFRTAAIGDPAGRFAWVLDRAPRGGMDRIEAARQVLEFSGFDLSTMQMRP